MIPQNTVIADTDRGDFTREGFLPATMYDSPYKKEIREIKGKNPGQGFELKIYEGTKEILTLAFDKQQHSGHYYLFFRIDSLRGMLEVHVWDISENRWLNDLSLPERSFRIRQSSE